MRLNSREQTLGKVSIQQAPQMLGHLLSCCVAARSCFVGDHVLLPYCLPGMQREAEFAESTARLKTFMEQLATADHALQQKQLQVAAKEAELQTLASSVAEREHVLRQEVAALELQRAALVAAADGARAQQEAAMEALRAEEDSLRSKSIEIDIAKAGEGARWVALS